mgnify:CR=1 FL=1
MDANTLFGVLQLLAFLAPLILIIISKAPFFPVRRTAVLATLSCAIVYAIYVGSSYLLKHQYAVERELYDFNGDGYISRNEMTTEQWERIQLMSNDTGLQLAPFVGIPVSLIVTGLWFGMAGATSFVWRKVS